MEQTSAYLKNFKSSFALAFRSSPVENPLFDVGVSEALRLFITSRGNRELETTAISRAVLKAYKRWKSHIPQKNLRKDLKSNLKQWIASLRLKTGSSRAALRKPQKVLYRSTAVGRTFKPLQLLHMDLADVSRLNPDKKRYRYPYVLVTVDAFSNYTVLTPVRSKTSKNILNAVMQAFSQLGVKDSKWLKTGVLPTTNLQTDRGSEFYNSDLRKFLRQRNINLFSTSGTGKAYLSESKIGQMKKQLVRISNILENSMQKNENRKQKGKIARRNADVPFTTYADDWTSRLTILQSKINNKRNTRTGFTPFELFKRFEISVDKKNLPGDFESAEKYLTRHANETDDRFEPKRDLYVRAKLMRVKNREQKRQGKLFSKERLPKIRVGDTVFLTKSRIRHEATEKSDKLFLKRSLDLGSEWDLTRPFKVKRILPSNSSSPKRYVLKLTSVRNKNKKNYRLRHTVFYREELLLDPKAKRKK